MPDNGGVLDELQVKATNAYSKLTLPETPMLFVEFHGSEAGVKEQAGGSAKTSRKKQRPAQS